ncbi:Glycosyl transferase, family 14-containing protein [Strongyloides ratti]|uniref:Glycosyl transferase, family 14-containing protein n=1 Tax=Strongyloides ratti TaxID=34506 RepID=A0A090N0D3_STRRB|nr:Glycosyl transferase, family 14-containing protein [Strongyloides ratti]CEF70487.1 Glycosyl transferase, family 14-containing protein [Strongyloides ratti]
MCSIRKICSTILTIILALIILDIAINVIFLLCPENYCEQYTDEFFYAFSYYWTYDVYHYATKNRDMHNIFKIKARKNKEANNVTKTYNFNNNDVDGYFVYYMNTSQEFTETNIYFDDPNVAYDQALCTYCTLHKFIVNKNYHLVNLINVPFKFKKFVASANSIDDICVESYVGLTREHCPKKTFMELKVNTSDVVGRNNVKPFWKPKYVNIDCNKIIKGDVEHVNKYKEEVIKYQEENLDMSCKAIKKRNFNIQDFPRNSLEKKYSVAYAYNVYKEYPILERRLASHYSPKNHYCYLVDSKSPEIYKLLKKLEKCIPNVYVAEKQYNMTSGGAYANIAQVECMKILLKKKWDYLYLQQNDDFPLKTTRQLLEVLEAMNFPVEMGYVDPSSTVPFRYNTSESWLYKDLNFFLEDDKRRQDPNIMLEKIVFQKGSVCIGVPRPTVQYMINKINLTTFLNKFNVGIYGNDELTWQTLFSDDKLQIPGYTPRKCIHVYHPRETFLNRKVIWSPETCPTNKYHHSICTWGVESLQHMKNYTELFGYRFRSEVDYGSEVCWMEFLYNRTHFYRHKRLDLWKYYNLPQSVLQRLKIKNDIERIRECKI